MTISTLSLVLAAMLVVISTGISFFFYRKLKQTQLDLTESQQTEILLAESQTRLNLVQERYDELQQRLKDQELALQAMATLKGELEGMQRLLEEKQARLLNREQAAETLQERLSNEQQESAELKERLQQLSQQSEEKIALLNNAKEQLTNEFKVLANQLFEEKQQQFSQASKISLEALLKPMSSSLEQFRQRIESTHKEDIEGRASLKEQLKQLQSLNSQMSQETQSLTQALKGESKTQGNWGEMILERLLERSGLRDGEEFIREKSFTTDDGKRLRPDVILNLPDNKHIIIDSKVSLTDYERALNADNSSDQQRFIKAHLSSLKMHIDTLAKKRYENLQQVNAPDFVLMFMPIEAAYLMAIETDSRVFEDAFDKRVAVVTPTTLFTTLKTIEQLWRYERQSENTVKLIQRAADVHDKFVGFISNFEKVGQQLSTAQKTYEDAHKQLSSGRGNLVRQAQMLKELAGKTKKELPEHFQQTDEVSSEKTSLDG